MGMGIGGGLPRNACRYEAVANYRNRRTFFTVESHVEADMTPGGRKRTFRNKASADNRADALNREIALARPNYVLHLPFAAVTDIGESDD